MKQTHSTKHEIEMQRSMPVNWLRILGIFWSVTGIVAIISAFTATMATVLLIGVLLLLAGLAQFVHVFANQSPNLVWRILSGGLYAAVGVALIMNPVGGAISITLLIAILFLAGGALRLAMAAKIRRLGVSGGWHFTGGILNLGLAALVLTGWPETGTWVIGLLVGIEMLFGGLTLLFAPKEIFYRFEP